MFECANCDKEFDGDDEFCYCETCVRRLKAVADKAKAWQEKIRQLGDYGAAFMTPSKADEDIHTVLFEVVKDIRDAKLEGE